MLAIIGKPPATGEVRSSCGATVDVVCFEEEERGGVVEAATAGEEATQGAS
jgi:hypothetical protein